MRILYDHQTFTGTRYGGVARYFYDLIRTVKNAPNFQAELALIFSNTEYLKDKTIGDYQSFSALPILGKTYTNVLFSHLNRANSAFKLFQKNYDLFHPTYYNDYFLPYIGKKPFVITSHDLIPELFSDKWAALDGYDKAHKQRILNKATKVIAVSENTKQDILEVFKIPEKKITVVHHATHFSSFKPKEDFDIKTPEKYLLYIGMRENYKNFDVFLKQLAPLLNKYPDLHLLCAGGHVFNKTELELMSDLKILDNVQYWHIDSDEMLYRLYQKAVAFIYPSLYEGFGIPILEAFSCGCPVILSNRSSFPEVGQNAALYFNPDDGDEMNHQIESVLMDSALRATFVTKGFERLKDFSLEKMTNQTMAVYKSILI